MANAVRKAVIPRQGSAPASCRRPRRSPRNAARSTSRPSVRRRGGRPGRHRGHPHHHGPRQAQPRGPLRPVDRAGGGPRAGRQARAAPRGAGAGRPGRHPLRPAGRGPGPGPRRVGGPQARRRRALRRHARRRHHGRALDRPRGHDRRLRPHRQLGRGLQGVPDRGDVLPRLRRPRAHRRRAARAPAGHRREAVPEEALQPRGDGALPVHERHLRRHRPDRRASAARSSSPTPSPSCSASSPSTVRLRRGPLRHRQEDRLLRATVELALDREDLGPEFRAYLAEMVRRRGIV